MVISAGGARDFGLLPRQLIQFVQRGFIRCFKGIDFVADDQRSRPEAKFAGEELSA